MPDAYPPPTWPDGRAPTAEPCPVCGERLAPSHLRVIGGSVESCPGGEPLDVAQAIIVAGV